MSLAILKMMLARTLHRTPTESEMADFLMAGRELAGDRVYIPQAQPTPERAQRILSLRDGGMSIRKIARAEGLSKSCVHRALSQIPALIVDSH